METRPLIAVTLGDPAGIGPEIIARALPGRVLNFCRPLVIGDAACVERHLQQYNPAVNVHKVASPKDAQFEANQLDVLDCAHVPDDLPMAQPSAASGRAAVEAIRKAVDLALAHEVHALTTAPINKEAIHLAGHPYPGHTEMLADFTGTEHVGLMLAGGDLRVVLATTHVPLEQVKALITKERVETILRVTHQWLRQVGIDRPRIAVTGLNPHCGDGGVFGDEESKAIVPALDTVRAEGMDVTGPHSADALFGRIHKTPCDAVVTMYHDQGMIPIKMASMGSAVNITLGLPILRTSVDHGTAYDIAGKGIASADSLVEALRMAARLSPTAHAAS
ncbi:MULTISPECIES: 4-hydroxythreonine-4-phosphate dehydrogenase PdxA [unclassified Nitrospina]|uniref:4-hydroxythreonine-4-phosphate dehydrogenase PdxA n=1 Tax=unclassified Nitrospina TaxID=2638683 RepID=UPI003F94E262